MSTQDLFGYIMCFIVFVGLYHCAKLLDSIPDIDITESEWKPVSGFEDLTEIQKAKILYNKVGTTVTCTGYFYAPHISTGLNIAKLHLPIPRTIPFIDNTGCTGVVMLTKNRKLK